MPMLALYPYSAHTITWVTAPAGGAADSTSVAAMPSQAIRGMVHLVTQCRSAVTAQPGSRVIPAQSQRCCRPDSVAPSTVKFQVSGRNLGTGP